MNTGKFWMAAVAGPVMVEVARIRGLRKWTETFRDPGRGVRGEGFDDVGPDGKVVLEEQKIYMRSPIKGHVRNLRDDGREREGGVEPNGRGRTRGTTTIAEKESIPKKLRWI